MTARRPTQATLCALAGALAFALAGGTVASSAQARSTHQFVSAFGSFEGASSVVVDQATEDVYVYDQAGEGSIHKFNAAGEAADFSGLGGNVIGGVGGGGGNPGFQEIAVSSAGVTSGDIYVAVPGQNVHIFDAAGGLIGELGEVGGTFGVAVDAAGDVYVSHYEGVVDKYTPSANPVTVADYTSALWGLGSGLAGIAVDAGGSVYVANLSGSVSVYEASQFNTLEIPAVGSQVANETGALAVAAGKSGDDLYIDRETSVAEYESSGTLLGVSGEEPAHALSESHGVAINDASGDLYASDGGVAERFGPELMYPRVVVGALTGLSPTAVTLNASVNPEGMAGTTCEFEYGTVTGVYTQKAPCVHSQPLSGSSAVAVSLPVTGLSPAVTYHYRLLAGNADGLASDSPDQQFTTPGAGISEEQALEITASTAVLKADIDPNESETTYHFEYDTTPYETGVAHGTSLPIPAPALGSGTTPVPVSVGLSGLTPATAYYYRVVAVSERSAGVHETFDGPDKALTTPALAGSTPAEACPNEQLRTEQPYGLGLPDCRAYEMVSPLEKAGQGVGDSLARAAVSGDAVTYQSRGVFAEGSAQSVGSQFENRYLSRRGPTGWSTENITPPTQAAENTQTPFDEVLFSSDLSRGVTESQYYPLTGESPAGYINLYTADFAASSYQLVNSNAPGASPYSEEFKEPQTGWPALAAGAPDLSRIVFDQNRHVYEWAAGRVGQVDVPPTGVTFAGEGSAGAALVKLGGDHWHAVSNDGSRVFFTGAEEITGNPEFQGNAAGKFGQVYVRENPLSSVEGCGAAGDSCTVEVSASQRTNGRGEPAPDPNGPRRASFWGASADGAKVFFTSRAELTSDADTGSADNRANLYEYDLETGVLSDLSVDRNPADVGGASVLGLVTASEDGSYVYFVAEGDLAGAAVSGKPNLYLSHAGTVSFIATLGAEDENDWKGGLSYFEGGPQNSEDEGHLNEVAELEHNASADGPPGHYVRVTADGVHLSFLSEVGLGGYDNEEAGQGQCPSLTGNRPQPTGRCQEVYLYDAESGRLVCASCDPDGARPVSNAVFGGQSFTYASDNLSEDGSRVFFQTGDPLVSHDSNGKQDVYEYEGAQVYPISDVAGNYASSFLDASTDGADVFIATADQLVPSDTDERADVYDVRVGGGFPVVASAAECDNGDSCKAPASSQPAIFGAPASATFAGPGNPVAPGASAPVAKTVVKAKAKPCKRGFVRKKKGRCVRRKPGKRVAGSKQGSK